MRKVAQPERDRVRRRRSKAGDLKRKKKSASIQVVGCGSSGAYFPLRLDGRSQRPPRWTWRAVSIRRRAAARPATVRPSRLSAINVWAFPADAFFQHGMPSTVTPRPRFEPHRKTATFVLIAISLFPFLHSASLPAKNSPSPCFPLDRVSQFLLIL